MRIRLTILLVLALTVAARGAMTPVQREAAADAADESAFLKAEKGDVDGAIADWTRALELIPGDAGFLFERGQARTMKKDYPGAIADYTAAIKDAPEDAEIYFERGVARTQVNDLAGALADYSTAIRLEPDEASYYSNRGFVRSLLNDSAAAIVDLDRAVALSPTSLGPRLGRARLYRSRGNLDEAMASVTAALESGWRVESVYTERAVLLHLMGDLDGAFANYRQAIAQNGSEKIVHFESYLLRKKKREDGFPDLARAVSRWEEGWGRTVGLYLIDLLPEREFLEKAAIGAAYARREQLTEAQYYIGMTALIGGNFAKAREHLQKSVAQGARHSYAHALAGAELKALK